MPGNYKIDESSFTIQEGEVLVFSATDDAGSSVFFAEQPKPKELNFDDFYKAQFADASTLGDVPFPSVTSKTKETTILSIVTPETWIIATTSSPLSAEDLKLIAQQIKRYKK